MGIRRMMGVWTLGSLAIVLLLAGCDPCKRLVKSGNLADKDSAAYCYYDRKQYETAAMLFEELLALYGPSERGEKMQFMYAQSKMRNGEVLIAAYHFREFTKRYPTSSLVEDATYYIGYCYYLQSQRFDLDQAETAQAIEYFMLYQKLYPNGDKMQKVTESISELRDKLARKSLNQADLYMRMEFYQSAVVAYSNFLFDFPDSEFREKAMYNRMEAAMLYAARSVPEKQPERFRQAKELYIKYIDTFGSGTKARDAERIYSKYAEQIKKAEAELLQTGQ